MVGGGAGSFIGGVHRIAARLDDQYELVAGALSSDPARALQSAAELHIAPDRAYTAFEAMAAAEAARPDGIDVVAIVTPNGSHAAICMAFLRAGIAVICDKPLTTSLQSGLEIAAIVQDRRLPFILTHNYSGYPMIREARARVAAGELGAIRVVQVEYPQEWLAEAAEAGANKQAAWRTDPARSGPAGSVGDIGTHAHHLAGFVTGLELESVSADLSSFVPGRRLDDDARMLLRYRGGARGMLWCSQVAIGHDNGLRLRVYGERGALQWVQAEPDTLHVTPLGQPTQRLRRGMPGLGREAAAATRIPAGHPEGYLEAFAQIYREAAHLLHAHLAAERMPMEAALLPGMKDGLQGMAFIEAVLQSHAQDGRWTALQPVPG